MINLIISYILELLLKWLIQWLKDQLKTTELPQAEDLAIYKEHFVRRIGFHIFLGRRRREIAAKAFDMTVSNLKNTAIRTSADPMMKLNRHKELAFMLTAGVQNDLESQFQ